MKRILIAPVRFYQRFISPAFPPSCRFEPTCSNYMIQAIESMDLRGSDGIGTDIAMSSLV